MKISKVYLLSIGLSCLTTWAFADDVIESVLNDVALQQNKTSITDANSLTCYINQKCTNKYTKLFYQQNPTKILWLDNGTLNANGINLINLLQDSYYEGLDPNRYQISQLKYLQNRIQQVNDAHSNVANEVLLDYEVSLTDAYLNYLNDIQNGVVNPNKTYQYWHVDKNSEINIYSQFIQAVNSNNLIQNLQNAAINHPQIYLDLRQQLKVYIDEYKSKDGHYIAFHSPLKLGMSNSTIAEVKLRLNQTKQYDFTNDYNHDKFNLQLQNSIKQIQSSNGLKATGWIDKKTMSIINQPPIAMIKKLAINLDRMRWLPSSIASRRVWVNIPSYQLQIYDSNALVKSMPVIVGGGKENKTCSTTSKIKTIELNPYWGVPNRIATKEYLHKIQESSGYLARHDMKLYQSGSSVEVDPSTIDWSKVTQKNFNYYIKQQPGTKNALGQYKFMFNNDCGIYLHDTANRGLFGRSDRSLSHGCVRVGDPKFLAPYLINSNTSGYDFTKVQAALSSREHKYVPLSKPIDVYIVYYTLYVDPNTDKLIPVKDIYNLDDINFSLNIPLTKESAPVNE